MLGDAYAEAVRGYAADVRARRFPGPDQVFSATAGRK
jgi:ketopantoate hydroxymethyltransferase